MNLITLFLSALLINNVVLNQFLGICPFLGVSRNKSSAIGMSFAVMFVILGSSILTYFLYHFVLVPLKLEFMDLITFILVVACFVQFVEMYLKKMLPSLYRSLGIYLPLITTNCVVLYVCLGNISANYNFIEMLVYSIAVPLGFALILIIFSNIRERMENAKIPAPLRGNPAALIIAAMMALAFSGLAGLV
ncbi:MAG: RnfABCDGE type electron transport complex subunit A [Erysipelotrichaceae bacterium]|jgi:electron transport complex protein RnfA|nr:RnfABCDGE type electron transport complex subunit A [Erysipelotrichaceae bacterium]